jgi:hypothetical protein
VRADNSVLITASQPQPTLVCPNARHGAGRTSLIHTFDQLALSLPEAEPDIFYLCTSNLYTDHKSSLHRIDLHDWIVGNRVEPQKVLIFPIELAA